MKIGDVDVLKSIIQLEHDIMVLNQALDYITKKNRELNLPDKEDVQAFKKEAIRRLQKKYPNMGITGKK